MAQTQRGRSQGIQPQHCGIGQVLLFSAFAKVMVAPGTIQHSETLSDQGFRGSWPPYFCLRVYLQYKRRLVTFAKFITRPGRLVRDGGSRSRTQLATSRCATTGILLCIPLTSLSRYYKDTDPSWVRHSIEIPDSPIHILVFGLKCY